MIIAHLTVDIIIDDVNSNSNNIVSEVIYEMFHILNCGFEIK